MHKSITFIALDKGEERLYEFIIEEAKARNYSVTLTDNIYAKDEIVFYCQHECFPSRRRAKLSCIMLHDLGQMHTFWPNIWVKERWSNFDIGFLPNIQWKKMWQDASCYHFVRPKRGCFYAGWPKADILHNERFLEKSQELACKINLVSNRPTVLYAPSWENDHKQLDFINSLKDMNVNMLIKHYPFDEKQFPQIFFEIKKMENICRGMKDVYILDPTESIFTAIALSDILVSEESSTLLENMLLGKPSVAVTDWLIPDQNPPRLPSTPYDFVIKTKKADMREKIAEILSNYTEYSDRAKQYRDENFPNIGTCSKKILDIVDSFVTNVKHTTMGLSPIESVQPLANKAVPEKLNSVYKHWRNYYRKLYVKNDSYFNKKYLRLRSIIGKIRLKMLRALLGRELFYNLKDGTRQIQDTVFQLKNTVETCTDLLLKQIHESPTIQETNTRTFAKYRNIHKGKDLIVMGTVPAVSSFEPIENTIIIGVNSAVLFDKVKLDYLFIQDFGLVNNNTLTEKIIAEYPCKKFFCHVGSVPCSVPVKYRDFENAEEYCRSTTGIYKTFVHLDICKAPLADLGSAIFPAFQFALWTYPRKIYLVGCDDNPFTQGYLNDPDRSYGWQKIKEFQQIYYPDVEIVSINPIGFRGMFKDIFTEAWLKENPDRGADAIDR